MDDRKQLADDFELPNQPVWEKNQIVRFNDCLEEQDDDQSLTTDQAIREAFAGRTIIQDDEALKLAILTSSTNSSLNGQQTTKSGFDPSTHTFNPDELKPTPIQRKSQKQLVRAEDKDDKYWDKRRKNNLAAKRSREARRSRENQISLRASYLEKDNALLKEELLTVKEELQILREKLIIAELENERHHNGIKSQTHINNNS